MFLLMRLPTIQSGLYGDEKVFRNQRVMRALNPYVPRDDPPGIKLVSNHSGESLFRYWSAGACCEPHGSHKTKRGRIILVRNQFESLADQARPVRVWDGLFAVCIIQVAEGRNPKPPALLNACRHSVLGLF